LKDIIQIEIGKFKCTIFHDLTFKYLAKDFFTNANPEELGQSLKKYNISPDNIPSPFIATLVETDDKKVLIDSGIGYSEKPVEFRGSSHLFKGRLLELLREYNIDKGEISDLIITHFHPDHIGGIISAEGKPNFPNARIHIHEDEWKYWHSTNFDHHPPMFKYFIEQKINLIAKSNLNIFAGDFVQIVPGITAIKADGHTPGQVAINIQSESKQMLYISDAILHPLHIEKIDWQTNYDLDHNKARKTREKLAELAYKGNMLVNAFHFEFPGLGMIDKVKNGWIWNNENLLFT
jgi:glyoxylase-like metal-dependent hydrolase (beta-lactamase superfamily II)